MSAALADFLISVLIEDEQSTFSRDELSEWLQDGVAAEAVEEFLNFPGDSWTTEELIAHLVSIDDHFWPQYEIHYDYLERYELEFGVSCRVRMERLGELAVFATKHQEVAHV